MFVELDLFNIVNSDWFLKWKTVNQWIDLFYMEGNYEYIINSYDPILLKDQRLQDQKSEKLKQLLSDSDYTVN